jgi:hypothetical protein
MIVNGFNLKRKSVMTYLSMFTIHATPLYLVLSFTRRDGLKLHIPWIIKTTAVERNDVVNHIPRTPLAILLRRWADMCALE